MSGASGEDGFRTPQCTDRCEYPVHRGHGFYIDFPIGDELPPVHVSTAEEFRVAVRNPRAVTIILDGPVTFDAPVEVDGRPQRVIVIPDHSTIEWAVPGALTLQGGV